MSELIIFVIFYFITLTKIIDSNTHGRESGFNDENYNLLGISKATWLPAKIWKASTKLQTSSNENISYFFPA